MNLDELKDNVKSLEAQSRALILEQGKAAIGGAFAELFTNYPLLESVKWAQYTPHFNDGDACVFGVDEFSGAVYDGKEIEEPTYGDDLPEDVRKDLKKISGALQSLGRSMEFIFGDHVEITAKPGGAFDVDEHDHD